MESEQQPTSTPAHPRTSSDYSLAPVVLFWEITRACALACRHCRANAQPRRHPQELTTEECVAVVEEITRFHPPPILILTGGDPLMRRDLFDVVAYAVSRGLRTSLSPSVTALMTPRSLARAYQAGIRHISISLDGATPEVHDRFRGVPGSFQRTLWAIRAAQEAGLTVQINTTVSKWNRTQLEAMAELVGTSQAAPWDLFFLVPTGRARSGEMLSAQEHEELFHWLYDLSRTVPYRVRTTLGQPFRRVALQRAAGEGRPADPLPSTNDGKGICFISHVGALYPSGFLPLPCANVRTRSLVEVYQNHPLFKALRDPGRLKGKCGICPFNAVCGGCRARAYGCSGDYLEADPCCTFDPRQEPRN